MWLTEEKEGKVRIEQCGANLCGYSVDAKSNQNGEQVLINMKPGKDSKWSGRILDPNTGSTYDSTIALKGSDTPAGSGLRLRRHVLRRPDLEPGELPQENPALRRFGTWRGAMCPSAPGRPSVSDGRLKRLYPTLTEYSASVTGSIQVE